MKILLSIKPEFAFKIFEGTKLFEFRKVLFKNKNVNRVVVYASTPVQRVIGEFDIDSVINDTIDNLWLKTKDGAGISKQYFYEYFKGKERGFAIKAKNAQLYKESLCIRKAFNIVPPQSFVYL